MSSKNKEKKVPELHSNNLIALLDLTKERMLDRRPSESNPAHYMKDIQESLEIDISNEDEEGKDHITTNMM